MSKQSLHYAIVKFCQDNNYELIQEYRFNTSRRWMADFYIKELNCLIEFEGMGGRAKGGIGGHQTLTSDPPKPFSNRLSRRFMFVQNR
jgi:hypothetical protein